MLLTLAGACLAEPLTLAVTPSPLALPVDVAQSRGFFAAEGVDVRVVDCSSGPRCLKQLFDRSVQLVTVTEMPVVSASFDRSDYAILSTISTSQSNIKLLGRKSAGITRPAQLSGKRIGVIAGTSSHYYLDAYLLFHDIDPQQIKLVPLMPETIVSALVQRQVDAIAAYSRHTGPLMKTLGADAALLEDTRIYTESYNLVVDRQTLAARGGEIVKLLRALARAERFIAEQPGLAKDVLQARTGLDRAYLDTIFPDFNYRLSLEQSLVGTMEGEARWALREGHVAAGRKPPNYLDFIEPAPLRTAAPSALPQ